MDERGEFVCKVHVGVVLSELAKRIWNERVDIWWSGWMYETVLTNLGFVLEEGHLEGEEEEEVCVII
jgi:hypothetical protein